MTIGPDIGSADPILSIGAIGVLILNRDGVAGDFTVNLGINLDILEVDVYARVIFNSSGSDMTLAPPGRAVRLPRRARGRRSKASPTRARSRPICSPASSRVQWRGQRAAVLHDQRPVAEPRVRHRSGRRHDQLASRRWPGTPTSSAPAGPTRGRGRRQPDPARVRQCERVRSDPDLRERVRAHRRPQLPARAQSRCLGDGGCQRVAEISSDGFYLNATVAIDAEPALGVRPRRPRGRS